MSCLRGPKCALIVLGALILFSSSIACKREATGVPGSVQRERVLSENQTLEWKVTSLSVTLDDGQAVTLEGDDAQAAFDIISRNATGPGGTNKECRLRLQRSWSGRWKAVGTIQPPQ